MTGNYGLGQRSELVQRDATSLTFYLELNFSTLKFSI